MNTNTVDKISIGRKHSTITKTRVRDSSVYDRKCTKNVGRPGPDQMIDDYTFYNHKQTAKTRRDFTLAPQKNGKWVKVRE